MSGFLDRLAVRAMGEAPLVHPRVRSRFEPVTGELPGGPVETVEPVEEVVAVPRTRESVAMPTFEPEPRRLSAERGAPGEGEPQPTMAEHLPVSTPSAAEKRKEKGHPRQALQGEGEMKAFRSTPTPALERLVAPPLPEDVSADGRGSRGVRVQEASQPERPLHVDKRHPLADFSIESVELRQLPLLRSRSALAEALPTVESDRRAPVSTLREESEPSETVVQVHIGRIDVRAAQPPAPERRPARPAGPRLTLADYLTRREERR